MYYQNKATYELKGDVFLISLRGEIISRTKDEGRAEKIIETVNYVIDDAWEDGYSEGGDQHGGDYDQGFEDGVAECESNHPSEEETE